MICLDPADKLYVQGRNVGAHYLLSEWPVDSIDGHLRTLCAIDRRHPDIDILLEARKELSTP